MREIVGPHQLLGAQLVGELECRPVVLEGERNMVAEIFRREPRQFLALHPVAMPLVGVVHAVHEMGGPAGIGLDTDHAQPGVPLEYAREDQHAHNVLAAANDGEEAVDLGPAWLTELVVAARCQNVPGER